MRFFLYMCIAMYPSHIITTTDSFMLRYVIH